MSLKSMLASEYRFIRFKLGQRVRRFAVSGTPGFGSPLAVAFFADRLRSARRFLEYGCGGSTMCAASIGIPFHCVESDSWFLGRVKQAIHKVGMGSPSHQIFEHRSIGRTERWGFPHCVLPPTPNRLRRFARYSDPPDHDTAEELPDVILVDGRFRLACALKVIRWLDGTTYTLVVDDYASRPEYHVLSQFAVLESMYGDTAVFSPLRGVNLRSIATAIRACETDPR